MPAFLKFTSGRRYATASHLVFRVAVFCIAVCHGLAHVVHAHELRIEEGKERIGVRIGDELFTEYLFSSQSSPVFYPVNAPGGQCLVRNYPFRDDVAGEAHDHPHHRSVWLGHGDVNGLDFWSGQARIRYREMEHIGADGFVALNDWMEGESVVCTERTTVRFVVDDRWRMIDLATELRPNGTSVRFGDTKEGTFAIRTHPRLRITSDDGRPLATAYNSEGVEGAAVWGKSARWVHYQNTIDDVSYAITVLDHPSSFRHPVLWHARDYGLVAANPFARHEMLGEPPGAGDFELRDGQSLDLRYAIVVWRGDVTAEEIEVVYERFASQLGRNSPR